MAPILSKVKQMFRRPKTGNKYVDLSDEVPQQAELQHQVNPTSSQAAEIQTEKFQMPRHAIWKSTNISLMSFRGRGLCSAVLLNNAKDVQELLESYAHRGPEDMYLDDDDFNLDLIVNYISKDEAPLHRAAFRPDRGAVLEVLLGCGARIEANIRDAHGLTPLLCACLSGYAENVKILLDRADVDVGAVDHYGRTALHIASQATRGDGEVFNLLLRSNTIRTDVNVASYKGRTPLFGLSKERLQFRPSSDPHSDRYAVTKTEALPLSALVLMLRVAGIDVNVATRSGKVAMHTTNAKFPKYFLAYFLFHEMVLRSQTERRERNALKQRGYRGRRGVWLRRHVRKFEWQPNGDNVQKVAEEPKKERRVRFGTTAVRSLRRAEATHRSRSNEAQPPSPTRGDIPDGFDGSFCDEPLQRCNAFVKK